MAEVARVFHYAGSSLVWCLSPLQNLAPRGGGAHRRGGGIAPLRLTSRLAPGPSGDDAAPPLKVDRLSLPLDYWNAVAAWAAMALPGSGVCRRAPSARRPGAGLALVPVSRARRCTSPTRGRGVGGGARHRRGDGDLSRNRWLAPARGRAPARPGGIGDCRDAVTAAIAARTAVRRRGRRSRGARGAALLGVGAVHLTHRLAPARCACRHGAPRPAVAAGAGPRRAGRRRRAARSRMPGTIPPPRAGRIQTAESDDPAERLTSLSGQRYDLDRRAGRLRGGARRGSGPGSFEFWWSRNTPLPRSSATPTRSTWNSSPSWGSPGSPLCSCSPAGCSCLRSMRPRRRDRPRAAWAAAVAMFAVFLFAAGVDWMWEPPP